MRNKWTRLLSLLISVSLLLSMFTVLTFAAEDALVVLYYNRDFDEGWDYDNGFDVGTLGSTKLMIDHEFDKNFENNYFLRVSTESDKSGYAAIPIKYPVSDGGTIFQLSVKPEGDTDLGTVLTAVTEEGVVYNMLSLANGTASVFGKTLCRLGATEWVDITYMFDWSGASCLVSAKVQGSDADPITVEAALVEGDEGVNVKTYTLGAPARSSNEKQSFRVDNLRVYNGPVTPLTEEEINAQGNGSLVKVDAPRPIIPDSASSKTNEQYIEEGVCMKVNTEWCLYAGEKRPIYSISEGVGYGAPVKIDGEVFLPLELVLEYLGYEKGKDYYVHTDGQSYDIATGAGATTYLCVGRDTAIVAGKTMQLTSAPGYVTKEVNGTSYSYLVVAMEDVEELFYSESDSSRKCYVTYDNMGLIILAERDDVITRADDDVHLSKMTGLMKRFIFDNPTGAQIREDVKEHTNNYMHPYLFADQARFDTLSAIWQAETQEEYDELVAADPTLDPTAWNLYLHDTLVSKMKIYQSHFLSNAMYVKPGDTNVYIGETVNTALTTLRNFASEGEYKAAYDLNPYKNDATGSNRTGLLPVHIALEWQPILLEKIAMYTGFVENGTMEAEADGRIYIGVSMIYQYEYCMNKNYPKYSYNSQALTFDDGYDVGGRSNPYATMMQDIAFAYQMNKDPKYAAYVYDRIMILGMWEHWGPSHFLNTADTVDLVATAFDWTYNGMVDAGLDPAKAAKVIYDNGVYEGYLSIVQRRCDHITARCPGGFDWLDNWDNWNAVCNSGMTIGALAIMEYEEYATQVDDMMTAIMPHMVNKGLREYAPDGSYYESATYWSYGTGNLFQMVDALYTSTGDDYGIMDGWGLEQTCYFAIHTESSDYQVWNYHDAGYSGGQNTEWAGWAGQFFGNYELYAYRLYQIQNGKAVTMIDILNFDANYANMEKVELELSYFSEGMDGWMGRESWEKGSIYSCIIGGENDVAHGDLDSGAFIYYNHGRIWIWELGSDDYNVAGFFDTKHLRWRHYMPGAEGQNIIMVTSHQDDSALRYGQNPWVGWGDMYKTGETGYGAYALINNETAYVQKDGDRAGTSVATVAKRGLLFTNNRKTVVLQDEIQFRGLESFVWTAHIYRYAGITLTDDGRTAYLTQTIGNEQITIRMSIVANNSNVRFTVEDTYDFQLEATFAPGEAVRDYGGVNEKYRGEGTAEQGVPWQKLTIKMQNALLFNCAVVFEEVDTNIPSKDTAPITYTWQTMEGWDPVAPDDYVQDEEQEPEENVQASFGSPKINDFMVYGTEYHSYYEEATVFTSNLGKAYHAMVRLHRAANHFNTNSLSGQNKVKYEQYLVDRQAFETASAALNQNQTGLADLGKALMGMTS